MVCSIPSQAGSKTAIPPSVSLVGIRHVRNGQLRPIVIGPVVIAGRRQRRNWTQDGRLIAIETPLGKDKLLLTSLAGEEAISCLFAYELEMLSADHAISPESLIGRNVKVVITSEDGKTRPIHGMVAQFRAGPLAGRELRQYSAHVVPWLWYLGHSTDCRIFQNLSVPDIIDQVFKTFGFTDYQLSVARGDYPKLEFCVQYRETALNFVSRLMEEVGIFYFFRHEKDRHVLVIADRNVSFSALPDPQLIYAPGHRSVRPRDAMGAHLRFSPRPLVAEGL